MPEIGSCEFENSINKEKGKRKKEKGKRKKGKGERKIHTVEPHGCAAFKEKGKCADQTLPSHGCVKND
jgi:hypothetical protein